jgi:DNA polymerase-3 subunit beta
MKITCNREKLLTAFRIASPVAPLRSPKAILQNVKLEAANGALTLLATDMEVGVRVAVEDVEIEQEGSAVLPVGRLGPILSENPSEKMRIVADPHGAVIKGDRSEYKLPSANPDEFPIVPTFTAQRYHQLPARLLREMIHRTSYAADNESGRFALGGVLMEFEESKILAIATDGRRLAKMEGAAESVGEHHKQDTQTIIPTRATQLIERALAHDLDQIVKISAAANEIIVQAPRVMIVSRLVEGRFPRWRDVIPSYSSATSVPLTVGPMYSAHRQASIVTSEDSRSIDFTFADGSLTLEASSQENGKSRVEMPISYDGEKVVVSLDNIFVSDFFKVLDPQMNFRLEVQDEDAPAIFLTDDGYTSVIMPMARDR